MRTVALDGGDDASHLLASLAGMQSEMRRDHAQRNARHRVAGQHGVAEVGAVPLPQQASDDAVTRCMLEIAQKILMRLRRRDFLQRDDVGADLAQHVDDALGCVTSVRADGSRTRRPWKPLLFAAGVIADAPLRCSLRRSTHANPTMMQIATASHANVPAPGSRIAAIARSTKNVSVVMPGARPITVPSRKSLQRMCDAPATTLTIENGAIGSILTNATVSSPRRARRRDRSLTREPASLRTVCRPSVRPMANVSAALASAPAIV